MAEAGAIRAGRAFVELLVGDKGLAGGLDRAGKRLQAWGSSVNAMGLKMLAAGSAIVAPLAAATKVFAEMGDQLAKASARTGVGVEALSALAYAADQSGTNLEGLESGLRHMSKTIVGAVQGTDEAVDSLAALGLKIEDLKGMTPDEQFLKIADALSKVVDPSAKAALAMKVFGKSGTQLIPLLADGADGINALTKRAKELGLTWSTEDAKAAEEFGDRLDDLWHVLKRAVATIGSAVVPIFRQAAVTITDAAVKAGAWIKTHEELIRTALKIGLGIAAAGAAFVVLGTSIKIVGGVVGGVGSALGIMGSVLGAVGTVMSTVLASGVGIVIAALAGLAVYLMYNSEVGQKTLAAIGGYFKELKDTATTAIGGIGDALKSGDIALAAQILWLGLKTAWAQGIQPLKDLWYGFTSGLVQVAVGAFDGMLAAWEIARNFLTESWTKLTTTLTTVWNDFSKGILMGWEVVQDGLAKMWLELGIGGLDENEKQQAHGMLDQDSTNAVRRLAAERDAANKAATDQRNKELEEEQKRHTAAMAKIGEDFNGTKAGADANAKADADADRKRMAELQEQLKAARNVAAAEAKTAKGPDLPAKPKIATPDELSASLDSLIKKGVTSNGTFNAAAYQSLQGAGAVDRIVAATEATAKNTKKLIGGRNGPHFG